MTKPSAKKTSAPKKRVKSIAHSAAKRVNIPTAESGRLERDSEQTPSAADYPRAPGDDMTLNPKLIWKGKATENRSPLSVVAAPIYVQEKIHPRALVDDLLRQTAADSDSDSSELFENFNGLSDPVARTEFYRHSQNWQNRLILGDSLQAMASLCERESLRGKVQCVYMDPPYGIKFNSFWQPEAKAGAAVKDSDQSREPEMVRAFRDTWKLGINSYLSYLRDRLAVAKELLTESGSCFVQISDENVHLVRCVMDEVFGNGNFVCQIAFRTAMTKPTTGLNNVFDYVLWYAKNKQDMKFRALFLPKDTAKKPSPSQLTAVNPQTKYKVDFNGKSYNPPNGWRVSEAGMKNLILADRIHVGQTLSYRRRASDFPYFQLDNIWNQQMSAINQTYVVETNTKVIQRCMLMSTDPGDLVIDPTCGGGTTAFVAEQWGRRWITMDASRVAISLTRARLMGAKFPYYFLQDSKEGAEKEAKLSGDKAPPADKKYGEDVRQGFVCERAVHITKRAITNNADIPNIHARHQPTMDDLRKQLNAALKQKWEEWQIPAAAEEQWTKAAQELHSQFIAEKQKRQKAMDDSIAQNAIIETLVDRPCENKKIVRVCGAFTVESLSPHRVIPVDDAVGSDGGDSRPDAETKNETRFWEVVRENLLQSGIKKSQTGEHVQLESAVPWEGGRHIQFSARYKDSPKKKVAICIGPEYGTVSPLLLVDAAREAADAFDILIVLGYAFEAHAGRDTIRIGRFPVDLVRMNNDLRMADRLAGGDGRDNLFVSIGEPDIDLQELDGGMLQVEIRGIDIYDPVTGEVKSDNKKDIACWFIDTDYNGESFFVRRAYFCGDGKDSFAKLKRSLSADISEEAWESLRATKSRPFPRPPGKKIAVKAVNLFGEESIKILSLSA